MVARAVADPNIVSLGDRVLLGNDTLSGLLVKLYAPAEILLCPEAQSLALVEGQIRIDVHFKRTAQTFVFLFYKHRQTVATVLGCV